MVRMDGDQEMINILSERKFLRRDFKINWLMTKVARTTEVSDSNNSNTSFMNMLR